MELHLCDCLTYLIFVYFCLFVVLSSDQFSWERPKNRMGEEGEQEEAALCTLLDENESLKRELASEKEKLERLRKEMTNLYYQHRSTQTSLQLLSNELLMQSQSKTPSLTKSIEMIKSIMATPSVLSTHIFNSEEEAHQPVLELDSCSQSESECEVIEEDSLMDGMVDTLEKAVMENETVIEELKSLPLQTQTIVDDLRLRLNVLYSSNMLLTSVIDSNNTYSHEMSVLYDTREYEISSLREELTNTQRLLSLSSSKILEYESMNASTQQPMHIETPSEPSEPSEPSGDDGIIIDTDAGQLNTACPNAIKACIQNLVSRVALAESRVAFAAKKSSFENRREESNQKVSLETQNALVVNYTKEIKKLQKKIKEYRAALIRKKEVIQRLHENNSKLRRNEIVYKKWIQEMNSLMDDRIVQPDNLRQRIAVS